MVVNDASNGAKKTQQNENQIRKELLLFGMQIVRGFEPTGCCVRSQERGCSLSVKLRL
jgi:hypothetical protein